MAEHHHHAHSHFGDVARMSIPRIALALVLTLAFVFVEAGAGLFANSLALLTDAAHNLTDVVALALSWYAIRLAIRPAHAGKTFGYHRVGILVALANSTTLVLISAGIFYEAYQRLLAPPVVAENVLIGVGALAFVVNLATAWMVSHGSESDLNLRSTYLHLMGDVLSTLGAVLAGIAIKFTGWQILDPLVSVLIGALILWNAWKILRETVDILLEGTPRDLDMYDLVSALEQVAGVHNVHDLHVWSINQSMRALSAHVLIDDMAISQGARIRQELNELLTHTYRIDHATLQFECAGCDPAVLYCNLAVPVGHEHEH